VIARFGTNNLPGGLAAVARSLRQGRINAPARSGPEACGNAFPASAPANWFGEALAAARPL